MEKGIEGKGEKHQKAMQTRGRGMTIILPNGEIGSWRLWSTAHISYGFESLAWGQR